MSVAAWGGLLIAWVAAIALPGPDIFLLLRLGVRERRAAVLAALGIMTGNLIWVTVSVLGITALLATLPFLLPAMQLVGVVILCWLGARSIHDGIAQLTHSEVTGSSAVSPRPWLLGLTTNLANPKVLIFFTALLTQFLPADAAWGTRLTIIVAMTMIGVAWFVGVAAASSAVSFRRWFGRAAPWFDIVAGALFIAVALAILIELASSLAR